MQYEINSANLTVVMESTDINAIVGENAKIDVGEALSYIETGTAEIDEAVQQGLEQIGIQVDCAENYADSAQQSAEMAYQYRTTYIYEQGIAADTWTINHNLNKYPSVTVVDSAENEIIASVKYQDANTCIIEMSLPFKGKAYLN